MKEYVFRLERVPMPKQSFRGRVERGATAKEDKVVGYTDAEVKKYCTSLVLEMRSQLKPPIRKLVGPLKLDITFVFPYLKSHTKAERDFVSAGGMLWKHTKPDVTDNLNKPVADALQGLVMENDSQIADFSARKIYGSRGCIIARISQLNP